MYITIDFASVLDFSFSGYTNFVKQSATGAAIIDAVIMCAGLIPSAVYAANAVPETKDTFFLNTIFTYIKRTS